METRPGILRRNFEKNYNTLVIVFAGWADPEYPNGQPFPFVKTFKEKPVKFVSIKDLDQCFYMNNLYDEDANVVSTGIQDHVRFLRGIIDESQCENIVTIGVSTGGFAAILFGVLLGVNHAVAFDPQTFIRPVKNYQSGRGWFSCDVVLHRDKAKKLNPTDVETYGNLCEIDYGIFTGKIQIHTGVARRDNRYKIHLEHDNMYENLEIHKYGEATIHAEIGYVLKMNGKLDEIANEVIE